VSGDGRAPLTVAVAQPRSLPDDVAANAVAHAAAVREAGARVVVFPELSLTGYELDAPAVAPDDPRLGPIVEACAEMGSVALIGSPVLGDETADAASGHRCIGILAVDASGVRVVYRKMWLGGAETGMFAAGGEPAAIDIDGHRLGLAVCRDTGIPKHAIDTVALGIDGYVAGVLETEEDAGVPAQRSARIARDHGVWVAIASFAGSTGGGYERAAGRSIIRAADGSVAAEAGPDVGSIARATIP
jgi:predicted amidohydrolase